MMVEVKDGEAYICVGGKVKKTKLKVIRVKSLKK